jgi:hypothetical protein
MRASSALERKSSLSALTFSAVATGMPRGV